MQRRIRDAANRLCQFVHQSFTPFFDVPSTLAFGDTASEGTSTKFARADHVHGMPDEPTDSIDDLTNTVLFYNEFLYALSTGLSNDLRTSAATITLGGRDVVGETGAFGSADFRSAASTTATGTVYAFLAPDGANLTTAQAVYVPRFTVFETRFAPAVNTTDLIQIIAVAGSIRTSADRNLATITDGVYFYVQTDGAGAGNWFARCTNNSNTTSVDTGVAPRTSGSDVKFDVLRITYDGSEVTFLINNVEVATISSNIPDTSRLTFGWGCATQNGTAVARTMCIDYLLYQGRKVAS